LAANVPIHIADELIWDRTMDAGRKSPKLAAVAAWMTLAASCATSTLQPLPPTPEGATSRPAVSDAVPVDGDKAAHARAQIAAAAGTMVGVNTIVVGGERFRFDCSGVARAIYAKAGHTLGYGKQQEVSSDTANLFALVRETGSLRNEHPLVGDLIFFDNTYDRNKNDRRDDILSHVGVVESIRDDGTVVFVHRVGKRVVRFNMNTARPRDVVDEQGNVLNHFLRAKSGTAPPETAGALFAAFGSLPMAAP
jgi:peptidoglycan DL-endopeptidase CwlO